MNIDIYHCQKCKRLLAMEPGTAELFHYAYLPDHSRSITIAFECCNEKMYLIKPNDRVLLLSDPINTIAEEDQLSIADTIYMPAISAPVGPATPLPDIMPIDIASSNETQYASVITPSVKPPFSLTNFLSLPSKKEVA